MTRTIHDINKIISTLKTIIKLPSTLEGERQAAINRLAELENIHKNDLEDIIYTTPGSKPINLIPGTHKFVDMTGCDAYLFIEDKIVMQYVDTNGEMCVKYFSSVEQACKFITNMNYYYFQCIRRPTDKMW